MKSILLPASILFRLSVAALSLLGSHSAMAATDTMTASDPGGTTSFNTAGKWLSGVAPHAGTDYATTFEMRGLATGTFAGDSLTLNSGGGALHGKMNGALTFNGAGLFLNGGTIYQGNSFGSGNIFGIAGTITANASTTSFLGAQGGESLDISGTIGGSGNLTIGGSVNSGNDISFVKFDAANTVSGTVSVVTPNSIQDATNRLLQLNNLNALQNATLALTGGGGAVNLVSFSSGSNTGAYNIGALSGATNQALTDTASTAVAISVGSNNASTTYSGVLSGAGSLTKVGTGTLTLSGENSYTGATTISAGTLLVSGSISGTTTVNGGLLGGTGTVGAVTVNSGAILQGGDGVSASGQLSSGGNVSLTDGSIIKLTLGASNSHSSLLRTGGTWSFDDNQAFSFVGTQAGTYDNIIAGLTGSETNLITGGSTAWNFSDVNWSYAFVYDNAGGVDLTILAVPEPNAATSLLGGLGALLGLQRFRRRTRTEA